MPVAQVRHRRSAPVLLQWRTCATLAAHLCYSSGAPVLLGQRTCATPPAMGCRQSDDGVSAE